MPSLHCSGCNTDWPVAEAYNPCPECGTETWSHQAKSITWHEAESRRKRAAFEQFYAEREAAKLRTNLEST